MRLKWRVESTPSSDRRRQRRRFYEWDRQLREELGRSPPREELSQSNPSTVPFGPSTREELRLRQPFSSEELRRLAPSLDPTRLFSRKAMEEPRSVSSLDPYKLWTSEEIWLRCKLSRPLSSGSGGEAIEN